MSAVPDRESVGEGMSRRALLRGGAGGAAGVALLSVDGAEAASRRYPQLRVVSLSKLRVNRPVSFDYPLEDQPSVLLDLGRAVPEGHRADGQHRRLQHALPAHGLPGRVPPRPRVSSCVRATRRSTTPSGSARSSKASHCVRFPRVQLRIQDGAVWAVGVDGLIYGYRTNLAPGRRVGGGS